MLKVLQDNRLKAVIFTIKKPNIPILENTVLSTVAYSFMTPKKVQALIEFLIPLGTVPS